MSVMLGSAELEIPVESPRGLGDEKQPGGAGFAVV